MTVTGAYMGGSFGWFGRTSCSLTLCYTTDNTAANIVKIVTTDLTNITNTDVIVYTANNLPSFFVISPETGTTISTTFNFANTTWTIGTPSTFTNDSTKTINMVSFPVINTKPSQTFEIAYTNLAPTFSVSIDGPCSLDTISLTYSISSALPSWISFTPVNTQYT